MHLSAKYRDRQREDEIFEKPIRGRGCYEPSHENQKRVVKMVDTVHHRNRRLKRLFVRLHSGVGQCTRLEPSP